MNSLIQNNCLFIVKIINVIFLSIRYNKINKIQYFFLRYYQVVLAIVWTSVCPVLRMCSRLQLRCLQRVVRSLVGLIHRNSLLLCMILLLLLPRLDWILFMQRLGRIIKNISHDLRFLVLLYILLLNIWILWKPRQLMHAHSHP